MMKVKNIITVFLFLQLFLTNTICQNTSVNKLDFVIDMVHNNPGEELYVSKFNKPETLNSMGYNGKSFFLFQSPQLAINWDKIDPDIFPQGSVERKWVNDKAKNIHSLYTEIKSKGLDVYCMSDLILFPKSLISKFGIEKTFSNPNDPQTEKYLRFLIHEMFIQFPELDGIIVRIGETYLEDAPYHQGGIANREDADKTIIPLLNILRDEICVRLDKKLIFRTWLSFDINTENYLKVSNAVEPHKNLTISVKHCEGDFHRGNPFSKVLGIGRHKQLVEVQCAREYEGKGAYPNYIAKGVIGGFEEHKLRKTESGICSIKELVEKSSLVKGIWTWSRGGGWEGPYIKNELWPELNAYVLSQWANNTNETEQAIFNRFSKSILKLSDKDVVRFRELELLSADAVIRGRSSVKFPHLIDTWWTRDQYIGFPKLPNNQATNYILAEKDSSVILWKRIVKLSNQIKFADKQTQLFVEISSKYGLHLYKIYRSIFYLSAIKQGVISKSETTKWLRYYDRAWKDFEKLKKNTACSTLYSKSEVRRQNYKPADEIINQMR